VGTHSDIAAVVERHDQAGVDKRRAVADQLLRFGAVVHGSRTDPREPSHAAQPVTGRREGSQSGACELDWSAPRRLRWRLDPPARGAARPDRHARRAAELAAIRSPRAKLNTEIARVQKALEEAESDLAVEQGTEPLAVAG
jgi:hypothetical protein